MYASFEKIHNFELNISKIMPARKKHMNMGCEYHYSTSNLRFHCSVSGQKYQLIVLILIPVKKKLRYN